MKGFLINTNKTNTREWVNADCIAYMHSVGDKEIEVILTPGKSITWSFETTEERDTKMDAILKYLKEV